MSEANNILVEDNLSFAIENRFIEYFAQRNIDITDMQSACKVRQNFFNAAWNYIYNALFRLDDNEKKIYNRKSKIDYDDADLLYNIAEIYISICEQYHVEPTYYGYSRLTGISSGTLQLWGMGEGLSGKANPQKLSDLTKYIRTASQAFTRSDLEDSTLGQITKANHDEEKGLLYARKTAVAAIGAVKIDSLAEITGRYIAGGRSGIEPE